MKKYKALINLFFLFFKIGAFTFGGGYAMISLIEDEFVFKKKWLEHDELLNIITIAQSTPGPIAINCATYLGYKRCGFLGSLFSTIGVVLPSFIIIFIISMFLNNLLEIKIIENAFLGIKAAVAILILQAAIRMIKKMKKNFLSVFLLIIITLITIAFDIFSVNFSSIYLILIGALIGLFLYLIQRIKKRGGEKK